MIKTSIKDIIESKKDFTLVCIDKEAIKRVRLRCIYQDGNPNYELVDDAYKKELVCQIRVLSDDNIQINESKELIIIGTIDEQASNA